MNSHFPLGSSDIRLATVPNASVRLSGNRRRTAGRWFAAIAALLLPTAMLAQTNFGSQSLGVAASANVTVIAQVAGSVSTVEVLTMGDSGLDFTAASLGSCTGANLAVGQTCSQQVNFTPLFPGLRQGAVVLLDSGNHVLGTSYLVGTGTGGLAVFVPGNIVPAAGSGAWDLVNDGQLAIDADLNLPSSVVLDASGDMYIADSIHDRIRKVDAATHIISTIAGNGNSTYTGDGGAAVNATLNTPSGVALDGAGNLYIADTGNNVIREIYASTGIIATVAGTGAAGSSGDGGPAIAAEFNQPWGVSVDNAGNVYIADTSNHRVRKLTLATGIVTTVAGDGFMNPDGSGAYAGDGGPATAAELNRPFAVAFDAAGNMYIPDSGNNRVRVVNTSGTISTFAGTGTVGYSGDGASATAAQLWAPSGVLVDPAQNVYISDTQNDAVRKVSAAGNISTIARSGVGADYYQNALYGVQLYGPIGLALDGYGNLYIADYFYMRIREVQANTAVLNFTPNPTRQGDTSAPLVQMLENDGNAPLALTAFTPDVNATVDATLTTCAAGTPLSVGSDCNIGAEFSPSVAGNPLVGNIDVTGQTVDSPLDLLLVGDATAVNSTTTVLTASPNPSNFGQNVTFTATVTTGAGTGALTGSVTFLDGAKPIQTGVAINSAGVATFTTPSLAVGTHSITASYVGDNLHFASTSAIVSQVVNEVTATTLASSANPSAVAASVTLTATVSASGGGGVTPVGTVTFNDGATVLATVPVNSGGIAAFTTSTLADGTNSITATYSGSTVYNLLPSTSAVLNQDVLAASTVVVGSSPNPSAYGSAVTFSATVTANGGQAPTGTVNFSDGATQIGTGTLVGTTGVATFSTSALTAGSHAITASYVGNSNDGPGTSTPIIQVVSLTPTATTLSVAPAPGIAGKAVTLSAAVKITAGSAAVTGTVTFTDGSAVLGTAQLAANGTATLAPILAPGPHALVATYGGDANDLASTSSPVPLSVNLATTATAIASSASPAVVLSTITFTASVSGNGGIPTGIVTFLVDGATAGTAPLNASGAATFTDAALSVGTHTVTATYAGDTDDNASSSSPLTEAVNAIPTTTGLGASATSGPNPQAALVATTMASSGPTPTGTVTFTNGSTVIGAATLDSSGVATLNPDLSPGTYNIVANYGGDAIHSASSSSPVTFSGTPIGFGIAVNPASMSLVSSQNGTVSVTLSSNNGFADTIGMGCLSLPAAVNCHFSSNSVTLKAGGQQTVQLTIDTNAPLSGGTSASNARPSGYSLAGLFLPASLVFGGIFWRFRKRHASVLVAALALFLSGAFLVTGCGGMSQSSAAPGTYTLQVGGVGANSDISHYQNVTLTITK